MSALRRFYKKRRSKRYGACSDVVREAGVEFAMPFFIYFLWPLMLAETHFSVTKPTKNLLMRTAP